ncbi:hypothetical protein G3A56_00095 [Rhizobium oryzihabitans]|uniref:Phage tail lysozyme domain-containing protein n=1 Tax=Rhizobium oryzihabitans TaxID=2267833 RepID=A0A7L5BCK9_9HYPH|nr:phage tail tip lysozyme [Rhizobium oryzihabitans]QIB36597.1 hypothetical protein G3A56_00095 [Rhizobium oryzihabitans]
MADTIREFLVSIGYGVDQQSERKFKDSVRSATLQAELMSKAIVAAAKTTAEALQQVAKNFDSLYWTSQRTGASVQNIRALSYAVSQLGGSYQGAIQSIEAFGQRLRTNPGYESLVKSLGVQTRARNGQLRDQIDVMEDLGKRLKSMPYYQANQYASALGIDETMLRALQSGELQRFIKEQKERDRAFGLNGDKASKASRDFMRGVNAMAASIETLFGKVLTDNMPKISEFMEKIQKWMVDNGPAISKAFGDAAEVIATLATNLGEVLDKLEPVWTGFTNIAESITGDKGLVAAIEVLVGAAVLGKLISMLGLLVGGTGGGLMGKFLGMLGIYGAAAAGANSIVNPGDGLTNAPRLGRWGVDDALRWGYGKVKGMFGGGGAGGSGSPQKGAPINVKQKWENAKRSYDFWRSKGLTRESALAMVGTEDGESGFNPNARGDFDSASGQYLAGGPFQHHRDRRNAILAATGIDMWDNNTSHEKKLEGAYWELTQGNDSQARRAWRKLLEGGPVEYGVSAATYDYERPRDKAGQTAVRTDLAYKWGKVLQDSPAGNDPNAFKRAHPAFGGNVVPPLMQPPGINAGSEVKMNQTTNISVVGSSNPTDTANAVAGKQESVNGRLLRNTQGAIR